MLSRAQPNRYFFKKLRSDCCTTHWRCGKRRMHSISWLVLSVLALIVAYGFVCTYRFTWTTVSDAILLFVLTTAAMAAGYLFG